MKSTTMMFPIEKCRKITLAQGAIYLGPSDEKQSVGYLELNPYTSLTLHKRPAIERLTQIKGKSNMVIFPKKMQVKTITMHEGDCLEVTPVNTWHIHVNPFNETCLQYWDFEGDIREIIDDIKVTV